MDVILTRGERPEWTGAKSSRRQAVAGTHRVLMMVGDDLNDFLDVAGRSVRERSELAARYADYWGDRWWMLPGPTYGSWERALWDSDYELDAAERIGRKVEYLDPGTRTERLEQ
jgi:acid phosphatase